LKGKHAVVFGNALGLERLDVLGFSLGGMVAQQIALERPSLFCKMLLVGTAPEGGEDIMHMEKPELKKITDDPNLSGLERLVKLFFAPSESSQRAGKAFAERLAKRTQDRPRVWPLQCQTRDEIEQHLSDVRTHATRIDLTNEGREPWFAPSDSLSTS